MREFQAIGAKVVMSRATAAALQAVHAYKKAFFVGAGMFTEDSYPEVSNPDIIFEDTHTLFLNGGGRVQLKEWHKPGVSTNQTTAWIPAAQAVVVGDLVSHQVHAWLEGGIVDGRAEPTLGSWMQLLQDVTAHYSPMADNLDVYGGRGPAYPLATAAAQQRTYLRTAQEIVSQYKRDLAGATPDYQELRRRFSVHFLPYQHSYLIQYGAYGLFEAIEVPK